MEISQVNRTQNITADFCERGLFGLNSSSLLNDVTVKNLYLEETFVP